MRTSSNDEANEARGRAHNLAWWLSALAAFAVSLGVGKVVPEADVW
jgi:hypothetical protein